LGNAGELTVGRCEIRPGCANPRHRHPNCEEVLHVLQGRIAHTAEGGSEVELLPGDSISIPAGVAHNARNLGGETAVLTISFSSANRETIGE
jgi:quercetin dioxygenase-like cupin family protein